MSSWGWSPWGPGGEPSSAHCPLCLTSVSSLSCLFQNLYSAANFFDHLRNALDILHREVGGGSHKLNTVQAWWGEEGKTPLPKELDKDMGSCPFHSLGVPPRKPHATWDQLQGSQA